MTLREEITVYEAYLEGEMKFGESMILKTSQIFLLSEYMVYFAHLNNIGQVRISEKVNHRNRLVRFDINLMKGSSFSYDTFCLP